MKIYVSSTNALCPQDFYWYENMKHLKTFISHIIFHQNLNPNYTCVVAEIKVNYNDCPLEDWLVQYCRENKIKLTLEVVA